MKAAFVPVDYSDLAAIFVAFLALIGAGVATADYAWDLPPGMPRPLVPADNPMTQAKVTLGKRLFVEQRLSSTGHYSCARCHRPELAFTDGRKTAIGATGEHHSRNTPTLYNTAYNASYGWADPTVTSLEQQHQIPMFNRAPVEMGLTREGFDSLLSTLNADLELHRDVVSAFPASGGKLTLTRITQAIASYVRTLISGNSAYDRYLYYDDRTHFSESARRGLALFFSDRLKCSECHVSFNFSGPIRSVEDPMPPTVFHNTGLYHLAQPKIAQGGYPDPGLYLITGKPEDMGAFRAPTLRNISLTAPYMHDGSLESLEEVIRFYAAGGRVITDGPHRGDGRNNPWKRAQVAGFQITRSEERDLMAFLVSLTEIPAP